MKIIHMIVLIISVLGLPKVLSIDILRRPPQTLFNVAQYGAKGDGRTDNTKAFLAAWHAACSSTWVSIIYVPRGNFLVNPVSFAGPCRNVRVTVWISGHINAPTVKSIFKEEYWLEFVNLNGLTIQGNGFKGDGVIDGQGASWWPKSCKGKGSECNEGPTSLRFNNVTNLKVIDITLLNSKQFHMVLYKCNIVEVTRVEIQAPPNTVNTDGIHVSHSSNVKIRNSTISTGDDCVAILSGSSNVLIQGGSCGPGHGISIGSLGKNGARAAVSNIRVDGVSFHDTTNGVRIKTWQGGNGFVRDLTFQNLIMGRNVKNPIIIDQSYCPRCGRGRNIQKPTGVRIINVLFENIKGTSASQEAISIVCSKSVPCEGIKLQDIQLSYNGKPAKCLVENAHITPISVVNPACR